MCQVVVCVLSALQRANESLHNTQNSSVAIIEGLRFLRG